jgi:hypothetical protein
LDRFANSRGSERRLLCNDAVARCEQIDEVHIDLTRIRFVLGQCSLIGSAQPMDASDAWRSEAPFRTDAAERDQDNALVSRNFQ